MQQLSLEVLLRIVRRVWKWLVLCGALGGLLLALVTYFWIPDKYVSQATLHIQNGTLSSDYISTNNLAAAQTLVDSTAIIFSSDVALEPAVAVLNDGTTMEELGAALSFSATTNSEAVIIKATANDPATAYAYCSALVEVSSDVIADVYEIARVQTLDKPKIPTSPSSPSMTKNTLLGVIVGAMLMMIAAIIHYLTDMRVGGEDDLKQRMKDMMVLGEIPAFTGTEKGGRNA